MKKIFFTMLIMSSLISFANAQSQEKVSIIKPTLGGAISMTFNKNFGYFNFAGPGLRAGYKDFGISAHMLPSLQFNFNKPTTGSSIRPILGTGLMFWYKRMSIVIIEYYNAAPMVDYKDKWTPAVGIGYKFGK